MQFKELQIGSHFQIEGLDTNESYVKIKPIIIKSPWDNAIVELNSLSCIEGEISKPCYLDPTLSIKTLK